MALNTFLKGFWKLLLSSLYRSLSLSLQETGNAFKWRSLYEELWSFSIKRIFLKAPKEFRCSLMTFPKQTWQLYGIIFHVNWFSIFLTFLRHTKSKYEGKKITTNLQTRYIKWIAASYLFNCQQINFLYQSFFIEWLLCWLMHLREKIKLLFNMAGVRLSKFFFALEWKMSTVKVSGNFETSNSKFSQGILNFPFE